MIGTLLKRLGEGGSAERPSSPGYCVYTRRYDETVDADNLDRVLGRPTPAVRQQMAEAWEVFESGTLAWRASADIQALEAVARIQSRLVADQLADTQVALLVDLSGSMRGQSILLAAVAADVARSFLVRLGVPVEILGFTTLRWRGGLSRLQWALLGRRRNPGRLNDLLHVVFAAADDRRPGSGTRALAQMLRPDLLKENIDGEALLWAADRMRRRPQRRRIICVISDGAPVDDSTLMENGPRYLVDHLAAVVQDLSTELTLGQLRLTADYPSPFPFAREALTAETIAGGLIALLEEMIAGEPAAVG